MQSLVVGSPRVAFKTCILVIFSLLTFLAGCSESSLEGVDKPASETGSTPTADDPSAADPEPEAETSDPSDAADPANPEPEPEPEPENLPPVAILVVTPTAGDLPLGVQLDASTSSDP